jgi:putative two-component system response regulator
MDKILQHEYTEAVQASCQDNLTGLLNHSFFQLSLDREIERSRRYGAPFVLALLDIDDFTAYNNKFGMLAGDILLKGIGSVLLRRGVRQSDLAARIAGDRFALLLVEITLPVAQKVLTRIHREISETLGPNFSLSMSIVSFPGNAATKETLLFLSEDVLAKAKESPTRKIFWHENNVIETDTEPAANILIVDDEPANVKLLTALLTANEYHVLKATSGEEALQCVVREDVDLILLDIMMPGMDGYEVCSLLKRTEATRMIPIVLITALDSVEAKVKGIEAGADDFLTKPPVRDELLARVRSLIRIKKVNSNLTSIENVLISLANIIEAKDSYTEGHIQRVATMALEIGKRFGMQKQDLESLKLGGILHDIGKIGVPGQILNKPSQLTSPEWEVMKKHVQTGYKICLPLQKNLGSALEIIRNHHERLDGSGYPDGLNGDQISLPVRIMAVVDMFDALTTKRSYRKAISREESLAIVEQDALEGKLDMEVVQQLKYFLIKQNKIDQQQV